MAMVGFDPQLVTNSMNNVENAYSDLMKALYNDMQSQFVDTMANYWACNEAQKFFKNEFKPAIDELLKGSFTTFQSVITSMNSAASNWAKATGSSWGGKNFSGAQKTINVDNIKENINGVRGAEEVQAPATAKKLSTIYSSCESALSKAKSAVSNCGFVGRDQEAKLISSLNTIKTNIGNATEKLTNSTNKAISNAIEMYGKLAVKVEGAFTAK